MPDNVGGRSASSPRSACSPIAVAGVDTDALLAGAREMEALCEIADYTNPAWQYAAMRHELYRSGKKIELLACFEPSFRFMAEWWKQLYGESEGKEGKGLFPASVDFTADLHSMGQYIQQGERTLLETVVRFAADPDQLTVPHDDVNGDGLNFLEGKTMDFINRQAMDGTPRPRRGRRPPTSSSPLASAMPAPSASSFTSLSSPAVCPAICSASIPSISPASRPTRRICSRCSASPATRRPARLCAPSSANKR